MAKNLKGVRFPGLPDPYMIPQIDETLKKPGFAADAKQTGDALNTKLPATHVNGFYQVTTGTEMTSKCLELFNAMQGLTAARYVFQVAGSFCFVTMYKTDNNYGAFEKVQYAQSGGAGIQYASVWAGNFTGWVSPGSGSGGASGMVEEFEATQKSGTNGNKIIKSGNACTFTTQGNLSKLYNITVRCTGVVGSSDPDALSSEGYFNSLLVGWKQVVAACTDPDIGEYYMAVPCYSPAGVFEGVAISATYNSSTGSITFRLTSNTWELYHIRGLY